MDVKGSLPYLLEDLLDSVLSQFNLIHTLILFIYDFRCALQIEEIKHYQIDINTKYAPGTCEQLFQL